MIYPSTRRSEFIQDNTVINGSESAFTAVTDQIISNHVKSDKHTTAVLQLKRLETIIIETLQTKSCSDHPDVIGPKQTLVLLLCQFLVVAPPPPPPPQSPSMHRCATTSSPFRMKKVFKNNNCKSYCPNLMNEGTSAPAARSIVIDQLALGCTSLNLNLSGPSPHLDHFYLRHHKVTHAYVPALLFEVY